LTEKLEGKGMWENLDFDGRIKLIYTKKFIRGRHGMDLKGIG
jgi:hypothetical protein